MDGQTQILWIVVRLQFTVTVLLKFLIPSPNHMTGFQMAIVRDTAFEYDRPPMWSWAHVDCVWMHVWEFARASVCVWNAREGAGGHICRPDRQDMREHMRCSSTYCASLGPRGHQASALPQLIIYRGLSAHTAFSLSGAPAFVAPMPAAKQQTDGRLAAESRLFMGAVNIGGGEAGQDGMGLSRERYLQRWRAAGSAVSKGQWEFSEKYPEGPTETERSASFPVIT